MNRQKCTDFASAIVAIFTDANLSPEEELGAVFLVLEAIEVALAKPKSGWGDVKALVANDGELVAEMMQHFHESQIADFGDASKPSELN